MVPTYCYIFCIHRQYAGVVVHSKKHLSFTAMRRSIGQVFGQIHDHRQAGKVDFTLLFGPFPAPAAGQTARALPIG